jgi:hypothetical protein
MIEIRVTPHAEEPSGRFDLLIACLGYEARSLYVAERYTGAAERRLAVAFRDRLVGHYRRNNQFYNAHGFKILPFDIDGFLHALRLELLAAQPKGDFGPRILIDISSMSRPMIATIVLALSRVCEKTPVDVVFVYCPAIFTKPSELRQPVTVSEPVIPELAGWSVQPERSAAAIAGLGFEFDQALGAIEFLEPAVAWTFIPFGEDPRYDTAAENANQELLATVSPERIIRYDVKDPYQCFVQLEALTYGLIDSMRPIIIPFGPKIFSLLSFLVAVIHSPNVTVWRVSGEQVGIPEDRVASGNVISLRALFLTTG